jgi:hypothetical protein
MNNFKELILLIRSMKNSLKKVKKRARFQALTYYKGILFTITDNTPIFTMKMYFIDGKYPWGLKLLNIFLEHVEIFNCYFVSPVIPIIT